MRRWLVREKDWLFGPNLAAASLACLSRTSFIGISKGSFSEVEFSESPGVSQMLCFWLPAVFSRNLMMLWVTSNQLWNQSGAYKNVVVEFLWKSPAHRKYQNIASLTGQEPQKLKFILCSLWFSGATAYCWFQEGVKILFVIGNSHLNRSLWGSEG